MAGDILISAQKEEVVQVHVLLPETTINFDDNDDSMRGSKKARKCLEIHLERYEHLKSRTNPFQHVWSPWKVTCHRVSMISYNVIIKKLSEIIDENRDIIVNLCFGHDFSDDLPGPSVALLLKQKGLGYFGNDPSSSLWMSRKSKVLERAQNLHIPTIPYTSLSVREHICDEFIEAQLKISSFEFPIIISNDQKIIEQSLASKTMIKEKICFSSQDASCHIRTCFNEGIFDIIIEPVLNEIIYEIPIICGGTYGYMLPIPAKKIQRDHPTTITTSLEQDPLETKFILDKTIKERVIILCQTMNLEQGIFTLQIYYDPKLETFRLKSLNSGVSLFPYWFESSIPDQTLSQHPPMNSVIDWAIYSGTISYQETEFLKAIQSCLDIKYLKKSPTIKESNISIRPCFTIEGQQCAFTELGVLRGEPVSFLTELKTMHYNTYQAITKFEGCYFDTLGYPESFLNHSCQPNLEIKFEDWSLRALHDIPPGTDLTFDYMYSEYVLSRPFNCLCLSLSCRGHMRGFKFLIGSDQALLVAHASPYIQDQYDSILDQYLDVT